MKKIVLIKPENIFGYTQYPPLELLTVGSVLEENGYKVRIINTVSQKNFVEVILRECEDAFLVGLTGYTSEIKSAIEITDAIKKRFDVPVVWGGWHATLFPEQTCQDNNIDFVIVGEGDYSLLKLVQALEGNGTLEDIAGLVYKKDGIVNMNPVRGHINLEDLPPIKYDLVDINRYVKTKLTDYFSREKNAWLPYQSSRGCPHRCTFCINVVTCNTNYRAKSAEKVIEEVSLFIDRYGLTHLRIIDDNFFVDRERVKKICDGFIEKGFDITWDAECRVDYFRHGYVDDELLKICKKSGLIELTLGCESGSQRILDQMMKKDIKVEDIINCVKQCHKHKVVPRCSFMVGIPGETTEDIILTAKLINRLRDIEQDMAVGIATFRPYPRSELCKDLIKEGVFREPESLREWSTKKYVEYYTERHNRLPWQTNPSLAQNMAFYYTASSGVLLSNSQIESRLLRTVNSFFIKLAKLRTDNLFFSLPLDKNLYEMFYRYYYKKNKE